MGLIDGNKNICEEVEMGKKGARELVTQGKQQWEGNQEIKSQKSRIGGESWHLQKPGNCRGYCFIVGNYFIVFQWF